MRPKFPLLLVVLGLAMCPFDAKAEIAWKQKMIELHANAESTVLEARFPFSNPGAAPVDVTQVESSCGCTSVNLEKRHYAPGESGEIVARYTVGAQTGTQTKTILVATGDGHAPTTLTLEIHLPEIVHILPPFVQWKRGETPLPKTMTLEILQDIPAKAVSVTSSLPGFNAQVAALVPGRKYELTVRPDGTDQPQFSPLTIRCRFGDQEKVFSSYAKVRPAETTD